MEKITFMTSYLTFYIKGEIMQERNFLNVKIPNDFLSIIPLGAIKDTKPPRKLEKCQIPQDISRKAK